MLCADDIHGLHGQNNIRRRDPASRINPPLLQPAEPRSRGDLCLSWQQWVSGGGGGGGGGCPQTSCIFHHALCKKLGRISDAADAMQCKSRASNKVLKCGDVWPEPSVSVATLHPLPHFAIQNKHGSCWMCVISVCHDTDRWNLSLSPRRRQCNPLPPPQVQPLAERKRKKHTAYGAAEGGKKKKEAEMFRNRYSRSVRCAPPSKSGGVARGRDFRPVVFEVKAFYESTIICRLM